MTNADLARSTVAANQVERQARASLCASDGDEQRAARAVVRQAVALRRALEQWIVQRATSAAQR